MAIANRPPVQHKDVRRIWKTPSSRLNWFFLVGSLFILGWVCLIYASAIRTQDFPGPYADPLRILGIVAFVLVLLVAAYTLRRRFLRGLPGKVHSWLWFHIWFGILSLLIACMHANFQGITRDISFLLDRFTEAAFGTTALYALLLLVVSGIVGRFLDLWQARVIAAEADTNGVGISRSLEERLLELSLVLERLSAGKSARFKQYVEHVRNGRGDDQSVPLVLPAGEGDALHRIDITLKEFTLLRHSLQRQQRATRIIRIWRSIHIPLAIVAVAIISYHSLFELWNMLILRQ